MASTLMLDPRLAEEAVLRELDRQEDRGDVLAIGRYRSERAALRGGQAPGSRLEKGYGQLHLEWFRALGFEGYLVERLRELPELALPEGGVHVVPCIAARGEGADVFRPPGPGGSPAVPILVLRLRPESFGALPRLTRLLRRDLLHAADMLDQAFGYDPDTLSRLEAPFQNLARDRYTLLWGLSVAARVRARWPEDDPLPMDQGLELLRRAYPDLGEETCDGLLRHVSAVRPDHTALVAWASSQGLPKSIEVPDEPTALTLPLVR